MRDLNMLGKAETEWVPKQMKDEKLPIVESGGASFEQPV